MTGPRATKPLRGYFIHLEPREMASFVRRDYDILTSRFRMTSHFYRGNLHALPDRVAIRLGVGASDFNFSWFGYLQAYWAVRFSQRLGKKSVVVLGGFDVCEEEDAALADRLPSIRFILRNADRLLAGSERIRRKTLAIDPTASISTIYHGFDSGTFSPGAKEPVVTTVGYVKEANLKRKGLEVFVQAARELPHLRFYLVGGWLDDSIRYLKSVAPPNVTFTGHISNRDLIDLLRRTSVYVQASLHEGFGCSLAEAMLCGCVPVVSDRGAIPEVVGDTGLYVDPTSPKDVADGIRQAMDESHRGSTARQRIVTNFPLSRRRELILEAVEEVLR